MFAFFQVFYRFDMHRFFWPLVLLSLGCSPVFGIPRNLLYDYGPHLDTALVKRYESSSAEIQLEVPIVFYNESYGFMYVNANGILSFFMDLPRFLNIEFPLDYPLIAPLYANVDLSSSGNVFFRETQDAGALKRSTESIRNAFRSGQYFTATSLFIATWNNVACHKLGIDKVNTFQVVIASNGTDSYVEFFYPEDGIQWIEGSTQDSRLPDARAQIGMVAGDGRYYTLPSSGKDQVQNVERSSNTDIPGVWLFHVGQINKDVIVMSPDLTKPVINITGESCASLGFTICHSKALCTNYESGFCCDCREGFYGNGINCLANDIPYRISGKLHGRINDVELENVDIQSYVITSDGRTYTAVSRVPESVGYDMQLLHLIGSVIGWTFARPINNAINGYQLTGGIFNHTSTLTFTQTGQKLVLRQKYLGSNVFNQLKMEAEIQGTLPVIPHGVKVEISEYEERYTRISAGNIFSRMNHFFTLEGIPVQHPFEMEHVVQYTECKNHPLNFTTLNMKTTRNLVIYEAHEEIVRYGMTSKILLPQGRDPCDEERNICMEHSTCVVDGDSHQCICLSGYQHILLQNSSRGDAVCVDVNECTSGMNDCHSHAECINEEGSYRCHCKVGYTGDGHSCDAEDCMVTNNCSPFAICQYNSITKRHICVCISGYYGDGVSCYESDSVKAKCNKTDCWCPDDFALEGITCQRTLVEPSSERSTLETLQMCINKCHTDAQCIYSELTGTFKCSCKSGYSGNGTHCEKGVVASCHLLGTCEPEEGCTEDEKEKGFTCKCKKNHRWNGTHCLLEISCNDDPAMCGPQASCVSNDSGRSKCQCDEGFEGDGIVCSLIANGSEEMLLVTQGMAILKISISQENAESRPITMKLFQEAVGIDVDCLQRRVYWSDITGKVIKNSFYNGSDVNILLNSDLGSLEGLSIDWISRNLYWTDSHKDTIEVTSLDRKERRVLISDGLTNPRGIAVHPELGIMFWSDWDRNAPKLESANVDGTGRKIFLQGALVKLPNSLAIDWETDELCWADAGIHAIGCVGINMSNPRIIVRGIKHPFGLAVTPSSYFWTDWQTQKIESAQKHGGHRNQAIISLSPAIGKLYGIVSIPKQCPKLSNVCAYENGLCGSDQLCLPKGSTDRNCACFDFTSEGSGNELMCN